MDPAAVAGHLTGHTSVTGSEPFLRASGRLPESWASRPDRGVGRRPVRPEPANWSPFPLALKEAVPWPAIVSSSCARRHAVHVHHLVAGHLAPAAWLRLRAGRGPGSRRRSVRRPWQPAAARTRAWPLRAGPVAGRRQRSETGGPPSPAQARPAPRPARSPGPQARPRCQPRSPCDRPRGSRGGRG